MDTIKWKVEGMTCANCSLAVSKYLEKQGMAEVKVNIINGDVSFLPSANKDLDTISRGIESLGYTVIDEKPAGKPPRKSYSVTICSASSSAWYLPSPFWHICSTGGSIFPS